MKRPDLAAVWAAAGVACGGPSAPAPVPPGAPLAEITEAERGRFLLGKALFERLTTAEEGLGPLYNETRCSACHDAPASGGSGPALVLKATRFAAGVCDLLERVGGDNIQQRATPALMALGITGESVPEEATGRARVTGPPLFGLGLVAAIPDAVLRQREDPGDEDGDGISGRAGRTQDGRLGRFGRKAELATIADFIDTALRFELGLTTPMHPREETVNGVPVPAAADPMPEPEIEQRGIDLLTDFVRFLGPPPREEAINNSVADSIRRGEQLFGEIGCTGCHVPALATGDHEIPALRSKTVNLYSDLLLHDLGPALGTVCGPNASPSEHRTTPLWGLRFRDVYLHDGRATRLEEAIGMHGGEAESARRAVSELSTTDRALLIRFLRSL